MTTWQSTLQEIFNAVTSSNYRLAAATALIFICALARAYGPQRLKKNGALMWTFVVLVGALGGVGNALLSGTMNTLGDGVSVALYGAFVGLAAAGLFKGVKEFQGVPPVAGPPGPAVPEKTDPEDDKTTEVKVKPAEPEPLPSVPRSVPRSVLIAALALALAGCGGGICREAAHVNDLQCVARNAVVDCSAGAMINVVKAFEPVVFALVLQLTGSDGTVNWGALGDALKSIGISDAACILAKIETSLESKMSSSVAAKTTSSSFGEGFEAFRAKNLPAGARIKMPGGSFR